MITACYLLSVTDVGSVVDVKAGILTLFDLKGL